jgi:hypothetical protein
LSWSLRGNAAVLVVVSLVDLHVARRRLVVLLLTWC